jgi:plastocyanin
VRRRAAALAVVAGLLATAPAAHAMEMPGDGPAVTIVGTSFLPDAIDVLAGDTVAWHNDSVLRHTVTAADGSFGSAPLFGGDMYTHRFDSPGVVAYYCTVHPFMHGEVDVHRVLLDAPRAPGAPGAPYPLDGRAALPAGTTVAIERDAGAGFVPAGSATVGDDGAFTAQVRSAATASYRAVAGGEASPAVRLVIVDRHVTARAPRRGLVVARVAPASPGATVVLQLHLRERFGWWPVARARVDRHSRARFVVKSPHRRVRARVVLTLSDGATQLARSKTFRVRSRT